MIARLTGILVETSADSAVIDVGGVGYLVHLSGKTLGAIGAAGGEVMILTELQVREDAWTLFGFGSAAERDAFRALTSIQGVGGRLALAILSAWTLLFVRLREPPLRSHIVIQRNCVEYLRPMSSDFEAHCVAPAAPEWERFTESLRRRGRARISLHAELRCEGELGGTYQGTYVADRDAGEAQ